MNKILLAFLLGYFFRKTYHDPRVVEMRVAISDRVKSYLKSMIYDIVTQATKQFLYGSEVTRTPFGDKTRYDVSFMDRRNRK